MAADKITFRAVPDHLRAADAAKRPQRGHEVNRLKDVRLALRVVAEQQMESRQKIRVQPRVIAEVSESQMGQMHAKKMERGRLVREFFQPEKNLVVACSPVAEPVEPQARRYSLKMFSWRMVPCVIFEDEHLLVV